jgi:hypothetical protein
MDRFRVGVEKIFLLQGRGLSLIKAKDFPHNGGKEI